MIVALASLMLMLQPAGVDAPSNPAETIAAMKQLYADSCGERAYATYDGVCNQIADQIRQAEIEARRAARAARKAARTAPPPVATRQSQAPATATVNPSAPKPP